MRLGNFSVSLAVKDIHRSRAFYEKLGFRVVGGDAAKNWLILRNESCSGRRRWLAGCTASPPGWRSSPALPLSGGPDIRALSLSSRPILSRTRWNSSPCERCSA